MHNAFQSIEDIQSATANRRSGQDFAEIPWAMCICVSVTLCLFLSIKFNKKKREDVWRRRDAPSDRLDLDIIYCAAHWCHFHIFKFSAIYSYILELSINSKKIWNFNSCFRRHWLRIISNVWFCVWDNLNLVNVSVFFSILKGNSCH